MCPFRLFSKYKQKLPFCHTFWPPKKLGRKSLIVTNMTWSNLRFSVWRSFVTMATNLPSCFSIEFLEQLLKFLVNFISLKYVKSQRSYGFLIAEELIFGFQILDLKDHFSASLMAYFIEFWNWKKIKLLWETAVTQFPTTKVIMWGIT